jgi:hypothetical protein
MITHTSSRTRRSKFLPSHASINTIVKIPQSNLAKRRKYLVKHVNIYYIGKKCHINWKTYKFVCLGTGG